MRLDVVRQAKDFLSTQIQSFSSNLSSENLSEEFRLLPHESFRRRFVRNIAPTVLKLQQRHFRKLTRVTIPFYCDLLSLGERFSQDASLKTLLGLLGKEPVWNILIPGCFFAREDVQFWLRRGIKQLTAIDVLPMNEYWARVIPQLRSKFETQIFFRQASIEALPFEDDAFDFITSSAVLEHVHNLSSAAKETARVLRPGGLAWHSFGPLYYTHGGDHCIAAYGKHSGYDHLLLNEPEYQKRIFDQNFYDKQADPRMAFWARHKQFSFATASEYVAIFSRHFRINHMLVKISEDALAFRKAYPELWEKLTGAGILEADLLIKSLIFILRK